MYVTGDTYNFSNKYTCGDGDPIAKVAPSGSYSLAASSWNAEIRAIAGGIAMFIYGVYSNNVMIMIGERSTASAGTMGLGFTRKYENGFIHLKK